MDNSAHSKATAIALDPAIATLAAEGSASTAYFQALSSTNSNENSADVADVAHYLCRLHGHFPGVLDHACGRASDADLRKWLNEAASAFTEERSQMTRLTVVAGPISSTPGQDESNAAIQQLRQSLDLLAQSERAGSAVGTACMLLADWADIRDLLKHIAARLNFEFSPTGLPTRGAALSRYQDVAEQTGHVRAMYFGASQLLTQHRAFWQLMEARAEARRARR